ncbi:right-handed parallel beta-helix repeat-containing protein [Chitinophaga filiformis]|uniref:DUF6519 domain-containing protein n=1 Tax=Chitinophaga filiformis TaxID=104663 RepID=UPI001F338909|nr:DUF6519 domain-containing protein [Chitinophaga filiformis]MCF6407768.1 right-handed parallel beta-helix repeat-containing protein [Chitinophaga filiformis]
MATFDISRVAFDPRKHYASVRMQQGRVLTDDDWNENERIENEEKRRSRVDIIGPFGSPDKGFRVENLRITDGQTDFDIREGTLHLGGLRLEMDAPETYRLQKDWLQQPADINPAPLPAELPAEGQERFDLIYLEAWQQPVSAVEDDALFEAALAGPDTTTRVRNTRRVQIQENLTASECADAWTLLKQKWTADHLGTVNSKYERIPAVTLTADFTESGPADDLCTPAMAGGYLGAENQAIRVELIDADHLTWGFDNAAPLYRVTVAANGRVKMLTAPKDQYHWPLSGQVVEILPWSAVLSNGEKMAGLQGHITKVAASYNPDDTEFTLVDALPANFGSAWKEREDAEDLAGDEQYFFLRVWNRGTDIESLAAIPFTPGIAVPLGKTGLQVIIDGTDRVATDYWVIAVRPETPEIIVPWELKAGMPPFGIRRFFAPLGIIRWVNTGGQVSGEIITDCRKTFRPLTDQECCCTFTVGDGIRSHGDFDSIEEALQNLPAAGGKICVLPGIHNANVEIIGRSQVRISGCGEQSIVRPHQNSDYRGFPIFRISSSDRIQIDHLTMVALEGIAVLVEDNVREEDFTRRITINHNSIVALVHAIRVHLPEGKQGDNGIHICHNNIGMLDDVRGLAGIFALADEVLIERNRLVVVPAPNRDPNDPRPEDPGGGIFDPCRNVGKFYNNNAFFKAQLKKIFQYVFAYVPAGSLLNYEALGGIQIGTTSEKVFVLENEITGGRGNGITLGHEQQGAGALYEIVIEENRIRQMGTSGIGVLNSIDAAGALMRIRTEDIMIYRNSIRYCALQTPEEAPANVAFGGIVLAYCELGIIQENRIEDNGISHERPICGIFILYGEQIDIFKNRITNNGPRTKEDNSDALRGIRGGIIIRMAFKAENSTAMLKTNVPSFDSTPAIRVHENIVTQPLGHSLFITAFGPVSVSGNQLTSEGIDRRNVYSLLAGNVFIFNLGLSKDLLVIALGAALKNMANVDPTTGQSNVNNAALRAALKAYEYLPNGKVMFSDNQTTLDLRSTANELAASANMIVSLDDIGFTSNQSECAAFLMTEPASFDIVLLNTYLIGFTIRSNDNRFADGFTFTAYSLLSYGNMNTCSGNQATHCLHVLGNKRIFQGNIILVNTNCPDTTKAIGNSLAVPVASYDA